MTKVIKNKRIAIMGSSPLMIILFYFLKSKNKVVIFEEDNIPGGAWKLQKHKNTFINSYSNVVLPFNDKDYNKQIRINSIIKKKRIGIKIKESSKKIFALYKPKKYFEYDFSNMYVNFLKNLKNIKNSKVKKITLLENDKIRINEKKTFDLVFFPSYFGVDHFFFKEKKININFKSIKSSHVSVLTNNINQKLIYSDFFNKHFDRVNMNKYKSFFHITARITKKFKTSKLGFLKKKFAESFPGILIKKLIIRKYKNYYRDQYQLNNLKKKLNKTKIIYVNTTSFIAGIYQILKLVHKY